MHLFYLSFSGCAFPWEVWILKNKRTKNAIREIKVPPSESPGVILAKDGDFNCSFGGEGRFPGAILIVANYRLIKKVGLIEIGEWNASREWNCQNQKWNRTRTKMGGRGVRWNLRSKSFRKRHILFLLGYFAEGNILVLVVSSFLPYWNRDVCFKFGKNE